MFSSLFTVFKGFNLSPKASGLASIFWTTHKFDKNQKRGPDGKWIKYGVGLAGKLSIEQNHRNYNVDDVVLRALDGDPAVVKKYNEAIAEVEADVRAGKSTNVIHSRNKDGTGGYSKARLKLHRKILDHFFKNEDDLKPTNPPPTFIVLGGRGGSGKSNFDKNSPHGTPSKFGVYDGKKSLLIDPDQIKELLPEYDPQKAYLAHEESAAIADKLHYLARKKGLNVVMDITLRNYHGAILSKFKKAGYRTEAHFMHRQPELALHGAVRRWNRKTVVKNPLTGEAKVFPKGRLVPPKVVEGNTHNEHNFDRMARMVDHWSVVSNTSPDGFSGVLVGTKPKPVRKLDSFAVVLKANPYHDAKGRFASKDIASSASHNELKMAPVDWKSSFKSEPHTPEDLAFIQGVAKSVMQDINSKYPGLADVEVELSRLRPKDGCHGICTYFPNDPAAPSVISLSEFSDDSLLEAAMVEEKLQKAGMPRWSVNASDRLALDREGSAAGTFRHEYGHVLARLAQDEAPTKMSVFQDAAWKTAEAQAKVGGPRGWVAKNVSSYALRDLHEFHAELFAQVSHPDYVRGTLPKQMETLVDNIVNLAGKRATQLKKWAKKGEAVDTPALHINIDPSASSIVAEVRHLMKGDSQPPLPTSKTVRKGFATVLKGNPYHEPAGSPQGGQFTSKEKLGYRVATSVQFAAMLKDIGASSPHAPWLKQQALATNLKAKSHGALDLELAHDWLKAGHSKATINEVGIDLTDDDLKAMAHWQSKSKAAATSLKTLFDKHYTKHYAQVQDAIATFGPDSAQVKKLNKVGVAWLAQAYKFGASPQQVKEGVEGVEKAYKDAKAKKVAEDAFAPGKGPYATLPSTKHMAENNLATLKEYHGKVVSALGKDHPHAKAAESEVEMAQIHLDSLKSVAANVGAPATGGSSAPKFQSSKHLAGSLETYHALAEHYYKLKASGKDQSDPAVQAAHSEWEKSKEELKSKHGWGAPELSKEAKAVKDMVAGASMSSPGLDKLKQQEKTSLMGSLKKMYKAAELDGTPLDYDLEKKALALGVDQTDISQLAQTAKKEAIEEKKALKSNALNSAKSAAYNKAKALDLYGKDSPEYAEAVAAHVATVSANLKHASGSEFDFHSDTGEAAYALFKVEQKKLKAKYGSLATDAAQYDSETFSMVSGMSHKLQSHEIPYSDFLGHAKSLTKNLTEQEQQAISSYTGSGYKKMNKNLGAAATSAKSGGQPEVGDWAVFKKITNLDSALAKSTLGSNTVVNRNMAGKWFWEGMGIDLGKATSSPDFGGLTDSDLKNLEGRVYKENAFSSTSIKEGNSVQFQAAAVEAGTVKMVIRVGKDKPALYVDHISENSGEQEVILPRGALYVIRSVTRQGNKFVANVDMVGADPEVITHKGKAYTGAKK